MSHRRRNLGYLAVFLLLSSSLALFFRYVETVNGSGDPVTADAEDSTEIRDRDAYWAARNGNFTLADRVKAISQTQSMPQANTLPPMVRPAGNAPSIPQPPSGNWSPIGPAPINSGVNYSGRIPALAIDPTTSGVNTVIYLGAANGGIWKSSNNGASWTPLTDNQPTLATGALTLDPNNHNVVYAGTGEPNQSADSYYGSGVLKTTDGGATWNLYGVSFFGTRSSTISRILVNPLNSNQVFASSSLGLAVSNDAGLTWTRVTAAALPSSGYFTADDFAIDGSTNPATLFVTARFHGLYKSTDGGASWSLQNNGLPGAAGWGNRSRLAMAPSNHSVLYLVIMNGAGAAFVSGTYNGGYYTTDGGASWNSLLAMNADFSSGPGGSQGWYDFQLAVDPLNDNLLYAGGIDVFEATNARGTSATGNWHNITHVYSGANSGIHPDQHALVFGACTVSPCRLYVGNDGGIFYTDNPTASNEHAVTYTDLNTAGLAITEYTGGDIGPNFGTTALALGGTQDNGTLLYTGNPIWTNRLGGDGGFALVDWTNPSIMYGTQQYGYMYRSSSGGTGFSSCGSTASSLFYAPINIDRTTTSHLVFGAVAGVYESSSSCASFYKSSQALTGSVSAVAVAPSNSAVIYAGTTAGQVYQATTANSGSQVTYNSSTGISGNWVTSFWVDPNNANTAYATIGSFYNGNSGAVFKTTTGTSWSSITGNLPAAPVQSIVAYTSTVGRVLVVGTNIGVFFSTNEGTSWTALNAGLPLTAVVQLAIDPATSTIVAFTHGRSAWKMVIQQVSPVHTDTVGIYRPSNATFYLRNSNTQGFADISATFGGDPTDYPITGDWNGDGIDTIGVYRRSTGTFYLRNSNTPGAPDVTPFILGSPNDYPLSGHWTADMTGDGVGVYRNSNGVLYLKKQLTSGFADFNAVLGIPGDFGVAGDWDSNGFDSPGVYRPSQVQFYLSNNSQPSGVTFGDITLIYGSAGDVPFVGDWVAQGHDGVGMFRPSNGFLYIKNALTTGYADNSFFYGIANDIPLAGKWVAGPIPPTSILVPGSSQQGKPPAQPTGQADGRLE